MTFKDIKEAYKTLKAKNGSGNDFLGWLDLPINHDSREFSLIKQAAAQIKAQSQVLLAIGIGGSYLGAKSAIEMLKPYFGHNSNGVEVIFVGNHISSTYVKDLLDYIKDKDFSINVISKSGTTTEPAIAFRIFCSQFSAICFNAESVFAQMLCTFVLNTSCLKSSLK